MQIRNVRVGVNCETPWELLCPVAEQGEWILEMEAAPGEDAVSVMVMMTGCLASHTWLINQGQSLRGWVPALREVHL